MSLLHIAPTKSNLQTLRRQLGFAEEGYDLLEQKRQVLVLELMRRVARVRELEQRTVEALRQAHAAQRDATLEIGTDALERTALATRRAHEVTVTRRRLMGLRLPESAARIQPSGAPYGPSGTTLRTDQAMQSFLELLPLLGELAGVQNAVVRLARELRKTRRRSNALSKLLIPAYRESISYISAALEERERESLIILKLIRNRLQPRGANDPVK